jgi:predicted permease
MRLYRLLLRLYPASFRAEYGTEMCALFAHRCRTANGLAAVASLWLEALRDAGVTGMQIHTDVLRRDVAYAVRTLLRAPGFALTVVLVSALGVGATTATFSMADHVLIRPLPFPDAERLVRVWQDQTVRGYSQVEISPGNYRDWVTMSTSFRRLGAYRGFSVNLVGTGDPMRLDGDEVTGTLFSVLGVHAALGRTFMAADDREGAPGTVILSHRLWITQFGGDPAVIGRTVTLDSEPHTIIGVMPSGFDFPDREAQFWRPFRFRPDAFVDRTNLCLRAVGRLREGVTIDRARTELRAIAARLERAYPKDNAYTSATVTRLRDSVSDRARLLLYTLAGGAACLLLIACTNVASLVAARGLARRKEMAIRTAMGAGRERIIRQMLTETVLLASCGGALGVVLAVSSAPFVAKLVPTTLPIAAVPGVNVRVLVIAAVVTVITAIGSGLLPAWRAAMQPDTVVALGEGVRTGGSRRSGRIRSVLVIAQVAASVVLLVTSGLLVRAFWKIQAIDPGFHADGVLTMRTSLPLPKYDSTARRAALYRRVVDDVQRLPGVTRAAYISFLPMTFPGGIWPVVVAGRPDEQGREPTASLRYVTPGAFAALGIPLHMGRDVAETDAATSLPVAVVSASLARRHWPGETPIGKQFEFAFQTRTVVGVVADVRVRGLERKSEPQVYLPHQQVPDGWLTYFVPKDLVIRSSVAPGALIPAVRRIIGAADSELPVSDVRMLHDVVAADTAPRRVQARALGAFAGLAFLLAAIGLYGLLAFSVSARTREFSVRRALGAPASNVVAMVLLQGARLAVAGVALGVSLSYAAGRSLEALLAGVSPADVPTLVAAVSICLCGMVIGSLVPAVRAVRVDPIEAMRVE